MELHNQSTLSTKKLIDNVFDNLKDFRNCADKLDIKFYLLCGLLLGLFRNGKPVEGDEDDTDVYIPDKYLDKILVLVGLLEKKGFKLLKTWKYKGKIEGLAVSRNGNRIDMAILHRKKNKYGDVRCSLGCYLKGKYGYYVAVFDSNYFEKDNFIEWRKENFPTIQKIEKFLEYRYGNWKVPFLRKDGYIFTDEKTNPTYKENWDINNLKHLL